MAEALCDMAVRSGRHSLPYAAPAAHTADWAAPDIAPGPGWHSLPYPPPSAHAVGRAAPDITPEPGRHSLPYAAPVTHTAGWAAPDIAHEPGARALVHRGWPMAICAALLLAACSGDPGTGPVEVKWDRDVCTRCNMVLSDRQHSAQIRYAPGGDKRSQVKKFDDFGCAVLWLDQQPWSSEPGVEFWVNDHRNGQWIAARQAYYLSGRQTPMQYGLSAQTQHAADALDFAQARDHIYRVEQTFNIHGGNLGHPNAAPTVPPINGDNAKGQ